MNRRPVPARHSAIVVVLTALVAATVVAVAAPAEAAERETRRIAGADRLATATAISERAFPDGAPVAYLARADVFADALAAGVLTDGPVLLVPSCGPVPKVVSDEVARLEPRRVIALGGTLAVCDAMLVAAAAGRTTGRIAGANRYETAVAISRRAFPGGADVVHVARATDSPDAVAGGSLTRGPILLVPSMGEVPASVRTEVGRLGASSVVGLGGTAAISQAVLDQVGRGRDTSRLVGPDRLATAAAVAAHQFGVASMVGSPADVVYLARADVFADAVAAGALQDGPVLLVPGCGTLPDVVAEQIGRLAPATVVALGGRAAVCDDLLQQAAGAAEPTIIPDTTVVLDQAQRAALTSYTQDGILTFDAAEAPDLDVGDVVVTRPVPGVAPQGFLRRVLDVTTGGGTTSVATEQALLTDAMHQGRISFRKELTAEDVVSWSSPFATTVGGRTTAGSRTPAAGFSEKLISTSFGRDVVLHDGDGDVSTTDDQVRVSGSLGLDLTFEAEVEIDKVPAPTVKQFTTAVVLDQTSNLSFDASENLSWAPTPVQILEIDFRCFAPGPIPLVLCPELEVELGSEGHATATLSWEANQAFESRVGAQYLDGAWSPLRWHDDTVDVGTPELRGNAEAKVWVRGEVDVEIYDVLGPYLWADLYVRGEAELVDPILCWGIYSGMAAGLGGEFDVPVIGQFEIPELTILDAEHLLLEDPVPHAPCGVSITGTITVDADARWDSSTGYWLNEQRGTLAKIRAVHSYEDSQGNTVYALVADAANVVYEREIWGELTCNGVTTETKRKDEAASLSGPSTAWEWGSSRDGVVGDLIITPTGEIRYWPYYVVLMAKGTAFGCGTSHSYEQGASPLSYSLHGTSPAPDGFVTDTDPDPTRIVVSEVYGLGDPPTAEMSAPGEITEYRYALTLDLTITGN